MPTKLNEFLHFALSLLLSTPSLLHDVVLANQTSWPTVAAILAEYGFKPEEIDAAQSEFFKPLQQDPSLQIAFKSTAQRLIASVGTYDPTMGAHPNLPQSQALVSFLRNAGEAATSGPVVLANRTNRSA